jgi:entericidin B
VFGELLPGVTTPRREIQHKRNVNMKAFKRVVVALVLGALIGIGALGCNTIKGAGKDVEKGGKSIQRSAEGAQRK